MNLRTVYEALRRRWHVLLTGLLLTAGMCTAAFMSTSPTYTATSSVLVLPPKSLIGQRGNPYLNLAGLGPAVDVLATRMMASTTAQDLIAANPDAQLSAEQDVTSSAPILLITVETPSGPTALELRNELTELADPTLEDMQDELSIAVGSRMSLSILSADSELDVSHRGQLRLVIVAGAVGLGLAFLGTAAIDGVLMRKRRRKSNHDDRHQGKKADSPALSDKTGTDRDESGSGGEIAEKDRTEAVSESEAVSENREAGPEAPVPEEEDGGSHTDDDQSGDISTPDDLDIEASPSSAGDDSGRSVANDAEDNDTEIHETAASAASSR